MLETEELVTEEQSPTNNNPYTMMEIEELVAERENNQQQQPLHNDWDWGAGDRVKNHKELVAEENNYHQLISSTMMEIVVTEEKATTNNNYITMVEIEELVTEEIHNPQQTIRNDGDWGAGDKWKNTSRWTANNTMMEIEELVTNEKHFTLNNQKQSFCIHGYWGADDRNNTQSAKNNQHQTIHTLRILDNNSLNTNPNNGDWRAMETIHNHCLLHAPNNKPLRIIDNNTQEPRE